MQDQQEKNVNLTGVANLTLLLILALLVGGFFGQPAATWIADFWNPVRHEERGIVEWNENHLQDGKLLELANTWAFGNAPVVRTFNGVRYVDAAGTMFESKSVPPVFKRCRIYFENGKVTLVEGLDFRERMHPLRF